MVYASFCRTLDLNPYPLNESNLRLSAAYLAKTSLNVNSLLLHIDEIRLLVKELGIRILALNEIKLDTADVLSEAASRDSLEAADPPPLLPLPPLARTGRYITPRAYRPQDDADSPSLTGIRERSPICREEEPEGQLSLDDLPPLPGSSSDEDDQQFFSGNDGGDDDDDDDGDDGAPLGDNAGDASAVVSATVYDHSRDHEEEPVDHDVEEPVPSPPAAPSDAAPSDTSSSLPPVPDEILGTPRRRLVIQQRASPYARSPAPGPSRSLNSYVYIGDSSPDLPVPSPGWQRPISLSSGSDYLKLFRPGWRRPISLSSGSDYLNFHPGWALPNVDSGFDMPSTYHFSRQGSPSVPPSPRPASSLGATPPPPPPPPPPPAMPPPPPQSSSPSSSFSPYSSDATVVPYSPFPSSRSATPTQELNRENIERLQRVLSEPGSNVGHTLNAAADAAERAALSSLYSTAPSEAVPDRRKRPGPARQRVRSSPSSSSKSTVAGDVSPLPSAPSAPVDRHRHYMSEQMAEDFPPVPHQMKET